MSEEQKSGIGGFVSGLQQKAGEVAEGLKDKAEGVIGEENVKKVSDVLNTDVGVMAKDSAGKAVDALENLTGRDIDGDGDIGGKPQA
ncbi:hypothetical protein [Pseudanabaena sp. BC1403]|uniref:hypothetical protein n=1 Tax=Pseudanabaena sp. BC1403 TaxID=2043171 RepID=UPI000CD8E5F8|nr:hypothetical protein [Pseudanabaena sp. BC1403]